MLAPLAIVGGSLFQFFTGSPFRGHSGDVAAVAAAPDGAKAVSGAHQSQFFDRNAIIWNVPSGKIDRRLRGHRAGIFSAAFSPDGQTIATGGGGAVRGRHWVHDHSIRIWNATGDTLCEFGKDLFFVYALTFSPDGKFLLSGSGNHAKKAPASDGSCLRLWEVNTEREVSRFGHHTSAANAVAFSPNGEYVAAGSYGMRADGSMAGGTTIRTSIHRKGEPQRAGETIMTKEQLAEYANSASLTREIGQSLKMLADRLNHEQLVSVCIEQPELSSAFEYQTVRIWETQSGQELGPFSYQGWVNSVAFSPDGKRLLSAGKGVILWDATSGQQIGHLGGKETEFTHCAAFSPDGRTVATGTGAQFEIGAPYDNCCVRLYDLATGRESARWNHQYPVKALAFIPNSRFILAGGDHGEMHLWEVPA